MASIRSSIISFNSAAADNEDDGVAESDAISLADHDAISWADNEETEDTPGSSSSVFICCRRQWKLIVGVMLVVLVIVVVSVAVILPTVILKQENSVNDSIDNSELVTGDWGEWGHWTNCSMNCDGGFQNRSRACQTRHQLIECIGNATETRLCNQEPCPVAGGWGDWNQWSSCNGHCFQSRQRSCDKPRPALGGANCAGDSEESGHCYTCPGDCSDLYRYRHFDGVYTIYPWLNITRPKQVYCEVDWFSNPEYCGWTVIQRRVDGSVNFSRPWDDYKAGFGRVSGEYWLGNDAINEITSRGDYKLKIRLTDWSNTTKYAYYHTFIIANESEGYRLSISGYSGEIGDSMKWNNGRQFTTYDVDNDGAPDVNCAVETRGAWWYGGKLSCSFSNLNGEYHPRPSASDRSGTGIYWMDWDGLDSLKVTTVTMMIQRR